jgi:membrane-bound lytic murein transglycosylase D
MAGTGDPANGNGPETAAFSETEIKARFKEMPSIISKRFSDETRKRIKIYVYSRREFTEELLGKSAMYFPIIEQYLKKHGLPLELRVLPIVETNFDPLAVSHAGATGMWQFMEGTAEGFGLTMDKGLDQRIDVHRSTEAAVLYLAKLYEKYEDWGLALAAYNCGPRHVNRAIKRGKSRDYWTISRFLPRETQKYVPRFLAASYLVNYYHVHDLLPAFPELDLQLTRDVQLPRVLCFDELAKISNTPVEVIRQLNPAYTDECLKTGPQGIMVTLPKRAADYVLGYLSLPTERLMLFNQVETEKVIADHQSEKEYILMHYVPQPSETLAHIASTFDVEESLLCLWNNMEPDPKFDGFRELHIYIPVIKRFHLPKFSAEVLPFYDGEKLSSIEGAMYNCAIAEIMAGVGEPVNYVYHTLGFGETFYEVCRQYHLTNKQMLREHNPKAMWTPGEIIRIPVEETIMAVAP